MEFILQYFSRKLFAVGLDSVCAYWRIYSSVHAAILMQSHSGDSDLYGLAMRRGQQRYDMHEWPASVRQSLLSLMEKTLLRSLRNSALDVSCTGFAVLLRSAVSSAAHPGDVGSMAHRRKCDLLWRVYIQCEVANMAVLLNVDNAAGSNVDSLSPIAARRVSERHRDNLKPYVDSLQIRLALLFSGDDSVTEDRSPAAAAIAGRDLAAMQGGLRLRHILLCRALGDLVVGDVVKEQFARQWAVVNANGEAGREQRDDLLARCLDVVETEVVAGIRRLSEYHGVVLRASNRSDVLL